MEPLNIHGLIEGRTITVGSTLCFNWGGCEQESSLQAFSLTFWGGVDYGSMLTQQLLVKVAGIQGLATRHNDMVMEFGIAFDLSVARKSAMRCFGTTLKSAVPWVARDLPNKEPGFSVTFGGRLLVDEASENCHAPTHIIDGEHLTPLGASVNKAVQAEGFRFKSLDNRQVVILPKGKDWGRDKQLQLFSLIGQGVGERDLVVSYVDLGEEGVAQTTLQT